MKNLNFPRPIQLVLISLFSFSSLVAVAGSTPTAPLNQLSTGLQEDRIKAEAANASNQQAITEIEAKKAELEIKKREIEETNAKTLQSVKQELTAEMLDAVMALKIPNCKVTKEPVNDQGRQDYTIENTDADGHKATIRFYFNTKRTLLAPLATPHKSSIDGLHYVEVKQPRFSPKDPTKDGYMEATVIYNPENYQVTHAVFTGERRFDVAFLWDSNQPFTISCLIGN